MWTLNTTFVIFFIWLTTRPDSISCLSISDSKITWMINTSRIIYVFTSCINIERFSAETCGIRWFWFRVWICLSMIDAKFKLSISGLTPMNIYCTPLWIPWCSAASPSFSPQSMLRAEFKSSRMMRTHFLIISVSLIIGIASPVGALHVVVNHSSSTSHFFFGLEISLFSNFIRIWSITRMRMFEWRWRW